MTRLHEGWDYLLYRIYIWGGLATLVIYILASALIFHADSQPDIRIYMGPVTLYFFGILAYWWWVFLFKGNKEVEETAQERSGTPEIRTLKSWSTLHQALAIYGGNTELVNDAKAARHPVLIWYGGANFLVVWILGCLWMGWLGVLPTQPHALIPADPYFPIMVIGIFVWIGLMIAGTPFLVGWASRGGEAAYLAPLGLSLTESPSVEPCLFALPDSDRAVTSEGAAVVEGSRQGRLVHIEMIGKHSYTLMQAATPPFKVHSQEGKLVADEDAPEAVVEALSELRKAKRWRGIEVTGGPGGIGIERKSKGQNMWLYDLWLIERLLEHLDRA